LCKLLWLYVWRVYKTVKWYNGMKSPKYQNKYNPLLEKFPWNQWFLAYLTLPKVLTHPSTNILLMPTYTGYFSWVVIPFMVRHLPRSSTIKIILPSPCMQKILSIIPLFMHSLYVCMCVCMPVCLPACECAYVCLRVCV